MKLAATLEDVQGASSTCLRCSWCAYGPWPENLPLCPIYWHEPSFTFSGGGATFSLPWPFWRTKLISTNL